MVTTCGLSWYKTRSNRYEAVDDPRIMSLKLVPSPVVGLTMRRSHVSLSMRGAAKGMDAMSLSTPRPPAAAGGAAMCLWVVGG